MEKNELFAYLAKNLKKLPDEDKAFEERIQEWIKKADAENAEKEIFCKGCNKTSKAKEYRYVVTEEKDAKYYHYSHMPERIVILQAVCPLCGGKQKRKVVKRFFEPQE